MPNREQIITVIMIAMYVNLVINSIATVIDMFNSNTEKKHVGDNTGYNGSDGGINSGADNDEKKRMSKSDIIQLLLYAVYVVIIMKVM